MKPRPKRKNAPGAGRPKGPERPHRLPNIQSAAFWKLQAMRLDKESTPATLERIILAHSKK